MDHVSQYIFTVCAAAIICGIVKNLTVKKGPVSELVHMMCGVFLTVTAISPLLKVQLGELSSFTQTHRFEAQQISADAEQEAIDAMREIIITQSEAYIMDKATSLNALIEVEVVLSEGTPGIPCAAIIKGIISPYAKTRLTEILESDLGISREAQQWKT